MMSGREEVTDEDNRESQIRNCKEKSANVSGFVIMESKEKIKEGLL